MSIIARFRKYMKVTKLGEIARRYFVMNAFDGVLTMLGILVGSFLSGSTDVKLIINAGIGASVALGMSGVTSAYMTEKAERVRELKELEDAMLLDLEDTLHGKAGKFASVFTAMINGVSPAFAGLLVLSPFLLVSQGLIPFKLAYVYSMGATVLVLFGLGAYLAKISEQSKIKNGVLMVFVGLLTALVVFVVSLI